MPPSDSQTFLRELFIRSGDIPVAGGSMMATGMSPLPPPPQVVSEARDKNANFAWVQHMLHHLAPNGSMALLLANGSMSSNSSGECDIRRALIEADLVETATRECAPLKTEGTPQVASEASDNMVALPGQLFTNTQIPACIWFFTKNNVVRGDLDSLANNLPLAA